MNTTPPQSQPQQKPSAEMYEPLLVVENLTVEYPGRTGQPPHRALESLSFTLDARRTLGIVGESGSGKSTLARVLVGLIDPLSGEVRYRGTPLPQTDTEAWVPIREKIQLVFQDPALSLNPRLRVRDILAEPLEIHRPEMDRRQRGEKIDEMLLKVGLEPAQAGRFPHEFSGGQRQRIGLARALAVEPEFLILDEPVSALDVSVQARILNLLRDLQESMSLTFLFIAHDLAVVRQMGDEVLVMCAGRAVEWAGAEAVYREPRHPYTQELIRAAPVL